MSVTTTKCIRKPLYVDAVRITKDNFDDIVAWCQGEVQRDEVPGKGTSKPFIRVRVHNPKNPRQTKAFPGDWLLYTERGYKVYTNKAFRESFDEVPVQDDPGVVVIGAQCFAAKDGSVLNWRGANYVPQGDQTLSGEETEDVIREDDEVVEPAQNGGVSLEERLGEGLQGPSTEGSEGAEDEASGQDDEEKAA